MNETDGGTRPAEMLPRSDMWWGEKSERANAKGEITRGRWVGGWVSWEARRQKLHDNFSSIDPEV